MHKGSIPTAKKPKKSLLCALNRKTRLQCNRVLQLSVPCGTISAPSVREARLRLVKCLRA